MAAIDTRHNIAPRMAFGASGAIVAPFESPGRIAMGLKLLTALMLSALPAAALAQAGTEDPYLWLEEVSSPRVMSWVETHNAASTKRLETDRRYQTLYNE